MKDKMQSFFRKPWALSVILTVLGIVLLLDPGMMLRSIVRLGGAALLIGGCSAIVSWTRRRNEAGVSYLDAGGGVIAVLGGLFLLFSPESLINLFPTIAGLLIILSGVYNVLQALDSKRAGFDRWHMSVLLAVITIVLGAIILANPFGTMELLVQILGGVLIYNGLSSLWIVTR